MSTGVWVSYPPDEALTSFTPIRCVTTTSGDATTISCRSRTSRRGSVGGVDVIGHGPSTTIALSGRVMCVRRLGGQIFLSNGPCGP
jgi:hypothetical protein